VNALSTYSNITKLIPWLNIIGLPFLLVLFFVTKGFKILIVSLRAKVWLQNLSQTIWYDSYAPFWQNLEAQEVKLASLLL